MNSLPPELLSSIIEQAAQCDSHYDSYRSRLRTLSSLSLVNRTFRELAQPLLPRKVWFRTDSALEEFGKIGKTDEVATLRYEPQEKNLCRQNFGGFLFMTEFKIGTTRRFNIAALDQHKHLKRLALYNTSVFLKTDSNNFAIPRLEELSLDAVSISGEDPQTLSSASSFLAASHFPSLRALGIKSLLCFDSMDSRIYIPVLIDFSLIPQLDCITIDQYDYRQWIRSRQPSSGSSLPSLSSIPALFDIDTTPPLSPSRLDDSVYANSHVRLRLVSNSIADTHRIVSFVEALLARSTTLKEIYLDLGRRRGKRTYELDEELRRRIEKVEQLAERKKVEVIWENHEDDWCRSTVSREFWRRSKENKEKAKESE